MRIGLISDTHGLLRQEAIDALQGVEHIIHAGDIGSQQILDQLAAIAPVSAISGNNDSAQWAQAIPPQRTVRLGGVSIYVTHDANALPPALPAGIQVVVSGHSHKPSVTSRDGVLFVNPGSAGPRRFKLPITLAILETASKPATVQIKPLL